MNKERPSDPQSLRPEDGTLLPENPTADKVIDILADELVAGCDPYTIDKSRATATIEVYRLPITIRLEEPQSWAKEGPAVRNAARQIGVISASIMSVRHPRTRGQRPVDETALSKAVKLVEDECPLPDPKQPGRWCGRDNETPVVTR